MRAQFLDTREQWSRQRMRADQRALLERTREWSYGERRRFIALARKAGTRGGREAFVKLARQFNTNGRLAEAKLRGERTHWQRFRLCPSNVQL